MHVKGIGQIKTGFFINEERIFGVVEPQKTTKT